MGKMMGNKPGTAFRAALLAACAALLVSAAGFSAGVQAASKTGKNAAAAVKSGKEQAAGDTGTELDVGDPDEILGFLEGTWALKSEETGEDYSELTFDKKGGVELVRLSDGVSCEGEITIEEAYYPGEEKIINSYYLTFSDIPAQFAGSSENMYPEVKSSASGRFLIGRAMGEDLLYLEENGNGISYIASVLFSENEENPSYENAALSWMLHRKNKLDPSDEKTAALFEAGAEDGEFYGFVWGRDGDGNLLVQKVVPYEYMTYEDFTNRHFMAAEISNDTNIAVVPYTVKRGADLDGVLDTRRFESDRALLMCRLTTDRMGRISSVQQVMQSYYGVYDLEELEAEWSWNDECLTYNGGEYYPRESYITSDDAMAPELTGPIMDCEQVGNWIVVTCHHNPHASFYFLFNIDSGNFERVLHGANLVWQGDDITTAYYSFMNTVYNYKGYVFAGVEADGDGTAEIMGLSFKDDGTTLEAEYSTFKDGKETEYSEEFELPEEDDCAMYRYADYLRRPTPARWKAFTDEAPEGSWLYVMANPPAEVRRYLPRSEEIVEGSSDYAAAVPLLDDMQIALYKCRQEIWDDEVYWVREKKLGEYQPAKGEAVTWTVTVPEGIPSHCVEARRGNRKTQWMIAPVTGKYAVSGAFVLEE